MKYWKFALSLILLGCLTNAVADMHGGHFGGGGQIAGHNTSQFHSGGHDGDHHHFDGFDHRRFGVVVLGGPFFWPGYDGGAPYYYPPPAYISQDDQTPVWYFCTEPRGYYPNVPDCPGGWQTIVATPSP